MPIDIVDLSTFTAPVVAPVDGVDNADAASIVPNGIQRLADRTRYLADRLGGAAGAAEWLYGDGTAVAAPKTRTRLLSPFMFTEGASAVAAAQYWSVAASGARPTAGFVRTSQANFARLACDLSTILPPGASARFANA